MDVFTMLYELRLQAKCSQHGPNNKPASNVTEWGRGLQTFFSKSYFEKIICGRQLLCYFTLVLPIILEMFCVHPYILSSFTLHLLHSADQHSSEVSSKVSSKFVVLLSIVIAKSSVYYQHQFFSGSSKTGIMLYQTGQDVQI